MSRALYLFDDRVAREWHPFALTRPAGELLFGRQLVHDRELLVDAPADRRSEVAGSERPAPRGHGAVGITAGVREVAGHAETPRGEGDGRRCAHGYGAARAGGRAVVVRDREGDGVRPACPVGVGRVGRGGAGAVSEAPAPRDHGAVPVRALVGEGAGEAGAARRKCRRRGRVEGHGAAGARRRPGESFSDVVLRAHWPDVGITAGELLSRYEHEGPFLSEAALDRIEAAKGADVPPEDKWSKD